MYHDGMDSKQARRVNLRHIIDNEYDGNIASFARAMDKQASQLNRIFALADKHRREVGEGLAREIEHITKRPRGWLDQDHTSSVKADGDKNVFLRTIKARDLVPVIDENEAREWTTAADFHEEHDGNCQYMPCPEEHGPNTYAMDLYNDTMTAPFGESYPISATIYVDPDLKNTVLSGDAVIAKVEGLPGVYFKTYISSGRDAKPYLKPLNPQYPIITDPFEILGKVIGSYTPAPKR